MVGFRFNVDIDYAAPIGLMENLDMQLFGNGKADLWLKAGHACARLEFADHRREEFYGLALGVEILRETHMSDIDVVHMGHDGHVVGGFTLRPVGTRPEGKR